MAVTTTQWEWDEQDAERVSPVTRQRTLLWFAVSCSLLLHGGLVAALLISARGEPGPMAVSPVRINLVSANPLTMQSAMEAAPEFIAERVVNDAGLTPDTPTELPAEPADIAEQVVPPESPNAVAESPGIVAPTAEADVRLRTPAISLPSILSIQQTIQAVNSEAQSQSWVYECNRLEEDAGLRTCDSNANAQNRYENIERNVHYETLNPVRQPSRTERSLSTVYQNTAAVVGALRADGVPDGLAGYMLEELAAGTSLYTNNGTDRNQHMRRMTHRSAAAQQADRVLGDSWVRGRAVELQQRNVHGN